MVLPPDASRARLELALANAFDAENRLLVAINDWEKQRAIVQAAAEQVGEDLSQSNVARVLNVTLAELQQRLREADRRMYGER